MRATAREHEPAGWPGWVACLGNGELALSDPGVEGPSVARAERCTLVFDGSLAGRAELMSGGAQGANEDDAGLLLHAYLALGERVLSRVRGSFCLLLWDGRNETLRCLRDRLGTYPLYTTGAGSELFFSTSIEALLRIHGISRELNRIAVASRLIRVPLQPEETYFRSIARVPPGHVLTIRSGRKRLSRYWTPAFGGLDSLAREEAISRFATLVTAATRRCFAPGSTAVMVSGGVDSITVAVAASTSRRSDAPAPLALSVVFPDPASSEEMIQRRVAADLGLQQLILPLEETTGPRGPFLAALAQNSVFSIPASSFWRPAFTELAAQGKRHGSTTILTGEGGDEWLQPPPHYAADRLRRLDLPALFALWRAWDRYYSYSSGAALQDMLYASGARPLIRSLAGSALARIAPELLIRLRCKRVEDSFPDWFAPDAELRQTLVDRITASSIPNPLRLLEQDRTLALDGSWFGLTLESYFEIAQRLGVRIRHPLIDDEILDFLCLLPPALLNLGGRVKGLAREYVLARLPDLGPRWPTKGNTRPYGQAVIMRDGQAAWQLLGNPRSLSDLGIVATERFAARVSRTLDSGDFAHAEDVWEVLSLEAWVRSRC